ncbi:CoA-binding protein [Ekhidna sp. MALMAid0563]|uniref:CoA-binding protein n=1 Tax=Ekhidna sp. MALMAid0563 TaxID=3143937 RepID=UPI0032DF039C
MNKKTAILGATPNPARYSYLAAERLKSKNHDIVPIGIKKGEVFGTEILDLREKPHVDGIDTVTMYIGPQNQGEWEDYILSLNPKRIIFNPGSENPSLVRKASEKGIETINACTLVMLGNGLY